MLNLRRGRFRRPSREVQVDIQTLFGDSEENGLQGPVACRVWTPTGSTPAEWEGELICLHGPVKRQAVQLCAAHDSSLLAAEVCADDDSVVFERVKGDLEWSREVYPTLRKLLAECPRGSSFARVTSVLTASVSLIADSSKTSNSTASSSTSVSFGDEFLVSARDHLAEQGLVPCWRVSGDRRRSEKSDSLLDAVFLPLDARLDFRWGTNAQYLSARELSELQSSAVHSVKAFLAPRLQLSSSLSSPRATRSPPGPGQQQPQVQSFDHSSGKLVEVKVRGTSERSMVLATIGRSVAILSQQTSAMVAVIDDKDTENPAVYQEACAALAGFIRGAGYASLCVVDQASRNFLLPGNDRRSPDRDPGSRTGLTLQPAQMPRARSPVTSPVIDRAGLKPHVNAHPGHLTRSETAPTLASHKEQQQAMAAAPRDRSPTLPGRRHRPTHLTRTTEIFIESEVRDHSSALRTRSDPIAQPDKTEPYLVTRYPQPAAQSAPPLPPRQANSFDSPQSHSPVPPELPPKRLSKNSESLNYDIADGHDGRKGKEVRANSLPTIAHRELPINRMASDMDLIRENSRDTGSSVANSLRSRSPLDMRSSSPAEGRSSPHMGGEGVKGSPKKVCVGKSPLTGRKTSDHVMIEPVTPTGTLPPPMAPRFTNAARVVDVNRQKGKADDDCVYVEPNLAPVYDQIQELHTAAAGAGSNANYLELVN